MARRGRFNSDEESGEKVKLSKDSWSHAVRLLRYAKPYRAVFIGGLVAITLSSISTLSFPFLLKKLIDTAQIGSGLAWWEKPGSLALIMVSLLVVQMLLSFLRVYLFTYVGEKSLADLRHDLYSHLIRLPMQFFAERRVGELSSRISSDLSQIQDAVTFMLADLLRGVLTLFVGMGLIMFISFQLTLVMLSVVPVVVVVAVIFGRYIRKLSKKAQDNLAESNTIVQETLSGIASVKAFSNEVFESLRYRKSLDTVVQVSVENGKTRGLFISIMIFSLFGSIVLVVWYGVGLMQAGELSFGDLTAFVVYTSFIGGSMAGFADLYSSLQKTLGATQRVREMLDENAEEDDVKINNKLKINTLKGFISFNDVAFSYPSRPDIPVLDRVSFTIEADSQVAIVGSSGAGKSTIASIVLGFYSPTSGEVMVDNISYKNMSINAIRKFLAYVPQDILLFGGTIRENIAYGKIGANDTEIALAAEKAFAKEFIEAFPDQYETVVGERGIKLSGGQRQRIAIARAILRDPAILILDEATSSLDAASEQLVQAALDNLMKNRTSIVIAHRLSTVRNADNILVLDKGTIKEAGKHEELIKLNGLYAHLVGLQLEASAAIT